MTNIRDEIRRLPWPLALVVVGLALVVLAARIVALLAACIADGMERAETVLAEAAGTIPIGTRLIITPADPQPGTTTGGIR